MEKFYCPKCDRKVDSAVQVKKEEIINVKGVPIKLRFVQVRFCLICKGEIYDYKLDTPTLIKAYEKYEEKTGEPILEELLKKKSKIPDRTDSNKYIQEAIERLKKKGNKK